MHKTFIIGSIFNVPLQTKTFLGPLSLKYYIYNILFTGNTLSPYTAYTRVRNRVQFNSQKRWFPLVLRYTEAPFADVS